MAVTLTAEIDLTGAMSAMADLNAAAQDLSPLMDQIGVLLETSTTDRIRSTNVSPDGVPWSPSFRSTFDGGKILSDTGRLANSITHIAGQDSVEVGTNLIYAGIHQTGGIIQAKNGNALMFVLPGGAVVVVEDVSIPARPYLGVSDEDAAEVTALTADYLGGAATQ